MLATLTKAEKKQIIGRVCEIAVRTLFTNFVYTFGGQSYLQLIGGPIGARVTMAVARIVMQKWGENFRVFLQNSGMPTPLLKGYVDDGRIVTMVLKMGARFDSKRGVFRVMGEGMEEDILRQASGETDVGRMARILLPAINHINPDVQFTVETADDFQSGWLPTLDLDLSLRGDTISHTYYQKPMRTPLLIMERSAMSSQMKYNILSNEVMRRLFAIGDDQNLGEKLRVLDQMTKQLRNSGYTYTQAANAISSGIRGDKKRRARRAHLGQPIYRLGASTLSIRNQKKLMANSTWFKNKVRDEFDDMWDGMIEKGGSGGPGQQPFQKMTKKGQDPKAVVTLPYTKEGTLAKQIRELEGNLESVTGFRLKITERVGRTLASILHKSDPWSGEPCDRQNCLTCDTKLSTGKGLANSCFKRNVVYETWCGICEDKEKEQKSVNNMAEEQDHNTTTRDTGERKNIPLHKYVGESGRSMYERGKEHYQDFKSLDKGSHILKHALEYHTEDPLGQMNFKMKVVKFHQTAFTDPRGSEDTKLQGIRLFTK